jgi:hypothetical protein
VWIGSILTFVWALAVPAVGATEVAKSFGLPLPLWQVSGVIALIGILLADGPALPKKRSRI